MLHKKARHPTPRGCKTRIQKVTSSLGGSGLRTARVSGMVTVETALNIATLSVICLGIVTALMGFVTKLHLTDQAREMARQLARNDPMNVPGLDPRVSVTTTRDGSFMHVHLATSLSILPITVTADSYSYVETS